MTARILVTTDGSTLAERAVPIAAALARAAGATVEVLSVAEQEPVATVENHDAEHGLAVAQQAANAVAGALRAEGVDAKAAAVVDRPADGILTAASATGHRPRPNRTGPARRLHCRLRPDSQNDWTDGRGQVDVAKGMGGTRAVG